MNNRAPKERTNACSVNRHQATCTRTDRDMNRICPSKLSRRELENLYFTLLENNVELKKSVNLQQEKIKTLSVKVQRLSHPRSAHSAGKDSPVTTAMVDEQRDSIIQLKQANERMAEKIRVLNMRLCSAKQLMGKKKVNNLNNSTLSSSCTKSNCTGSCVNLGIAGSSKVKTNSVGTMTDYFAEKYSNSSCDIKCKPTINELNGKINNLLEELLTSRQRLEKLEELVMRLQGENQTVRAEGATSQHALQQQDAELVDLKDKLRRAEAKVNDMNMELTIEKKKLAELETELKLSENVGNVISSSICKTIEEMEQKNVGGEGNATTNEAKLISDEINVASDEVHRAPDNVQFIRGEVINVGRKHRVPDDVEYNWGDFMAGTQQDTVADDKKLNNDDVNVARNEINSSLDDKTRRESNVSRNSKHRVPDDVEYNWGDFMAGTQQDTVADDKKLNNDDVNVARNEINSSLDDKTRRESNVSRCSKHRVPDDVEYNWGDFMAGTQQDTVADDKKLNNDDVNVSRNEINRALDDKTRRESNVSRNEVSEVPSGIILTRGEENVARNEDNTLLNVTRNEVNRVPDDVEYNGGNLMAGTQVNTVGDDKRLNNDDINVARNEINRTLDDKSRGESNVTTNEVVKVSSGKILKSAENFARNEDNNNMALDNGIFIWAEVKKATKSNMNRVPDDAEYKLDDFIAGTPADTVADDTILIKVEANVTRIEEKYAKNEVKSLMDDVKDHPGYREQQDLNKNIETEKDQPNIKLNQELINKISELVSQLEMLKITAAGEAYTVTDKIVKEKPTEFKPHDDVKTKIPDAISSPVNKQKRTRKLYHVKTKETDNTSSQAKKEKPMQSKPKKADCISHPINKQNPTPYKPYNVKTTKPEGNSFPTSINKPKPTQKLYDDKTKDSDIVSSQMNKEKSNQYESYDGKTEATDNISIRIDKDKPMKYESYDVNTGVDEILIQKNKDSPTIYESKEDDDIENQMTKQLEEYESIDVTTKEANNILRKRSNENVPKYNSIYGSNYGEPKDDDDIKNQMKNRLAEYESIDATTKEAENVSRKISNAKYKSYDFETKEFDDILTTNDTMECIMEVKSANERNKFKVQEPVSTYEGKGMSQDMEQKRISYPNIPLNEFDPNREQSIEKVSLASTSQYAQELKSKLKSPRSDDDARYQIPGPIPVDLNDQKKEVSGDPYFRKSIDDTPEIITDSYRKRLNKISYVEKSKQVGSIGDSPLKFLIGEKSAKHKNSYGESLRQRSLEEKSEKIRKNFSEPPNRISFQQLSEDNIRKPFRDLTARQSLDEKVMRISDTEDGERPVKKSKDPLSTRPSVSLSEKAVRMSVDNSSKETLLFDCQPRLSLSPKNASIIKDYARDVVAEAKSKKFKQRFSVPCVMEPPGPSRILQPAESIMKTKDAATSSPSNREPGGNDSPSPSFSLNNDLGGYAPPTAGGQESARIEPATTLAHMKDVHEPFEICCASAMVCECPRSDTRDVSIFRTCTGSIRFHTTQPLDNIRHCACGAKAVEHHDGGTGAGPSTQGRRNSGTSMDNKAPKTYSVADMISRATSPDHTDHEISSITDWASVRDEQRSLQNSIDARARYDSLISDRGTTIPTGTDGPFDQYTTVSEGEVPGGLTSHGEWDPGVGSNQRSQQQNNTNAMEATLRSISEELARCRKLLLSQRNQEKEKPVEHALRRAPASRQLSGTYTPVCVFALHIGTLVLSDEAVVWSRDKNLVLTWKFYSQNPSMTRVQPGRVAIFDFVTEYDVIFNDDMLNYMKNSEMAIVLSELGKEEKPFAKCGLPLREVLLHANRRADMSLALIPCETETSENIYNQQTFKDEIGVLDIWCSLRLDKSLLSAIDPGMRKPSYNGYEWEMEAPRESRGIQRAAEEEPSRHSIQSRQSRDFGLSSRLSQQNRALLMSMTPRRSYSEWTPGSKCRNFYEPGQDNFYEPCHASERYAEETQEERQQRQPPRYNFHSFTPPPPQKTQTHDDRSSGIIMNEVPANIRTDNDLREALEQKVRLESMAKWPKMDYDSSLKHSSFGSVRSLAARHQLAKLKFPQKYKSDYITTDSYQEMLNRDKQYIPNNTEGSDPNFSRSANANKYIGVPGINKLAEVSRKSVKYSNAIQQEPPKIIEITILWLALNEECEAMANPNIKRLYVAYSFLGRQGAELETPFSLPKPKHYADKCYFNFKKTFYLHEADLALVEHMATCRSGGDATLDPRDCIVFTLVSEPPEDPLGLSSCEDVGYAYLYLGDVLAYSGGSNGYTEVVGVHGVRGGVCGVLAVRIDNLEVLRICLTP